MPEQQATPRRFDVPALDGLRFVAFGAVFFHHLPTVPLWSVPATQRFAALGVDLFFCLSAFLLTTLILLERERTGRLALGKFFLRRILRIWPLYFFALALAFGVLPALGVLSPPLGSAEYHAMLREHLAPFLLLAGNLSTAAYGYPPSHALNLLWSISAEEQFYVVLPSFLLIVSRRPAMLGLAFLIGVAIRALLLYVQAPHPAVWVLPVARPEPFLVGIGLAMLAFSGRQPIRTDRHGWLAAIAAVALLAVAQSRPMFLGRWTELWQYPLAAAAFGLMVLLAYTGRPAPIARALGSRPLVWLGRISFGLYVYHFMMIEAATTWLPGADTRWLLVAGLALVGTVAVAAASYVLLERPFLRLKASYEVVRSRVA